MARQPRPKQPCRVMLCTNTHRPGLLMCPDCWRRVPHADRRTFYKAARDGTNAEYRAAMENVLTKSFEAR